MAINLHMQVSNLHEEVPHRTTVQQQTQEKTANYILSLRLNVFTMPARDYVVLRCIECNHGVKAECY